MVETSSIGALGYVMWGLAAMGSTLGIYRAGVAVQGVWAQQARSPEGKLSMEYIAFAMFPASQVLYPFIPQFMKQHHTQAAAVYGPAHEQRHGHGGKQHCDNQQACQYLAQGAVLQ